MIVDLNIITGLMLGFEYVGAMEDEDDFDHHIVIDILFLRIVIYF